MFIEKRKQGKKTKYYLIHTYRAGDDIKRISRYLGSDLKGNRLERLKERAEQLIREQIMERCILEGELSREEISFYSRFDRKIKITHFQDWKRFTEEFTYNTNAIEGSTVRKDEVKRLIGREEEPKGADELESINVAKAVDFIRKTKDNMSVGLILRLHKICFSGTKQFAGRLRNVEVVIKDRQGNIVHSGAPSKEVRGLLERLCGWYVGHKRKYPSLLLAAAVHNQFEMIHPFQDGNGRVGRLLLNYILLKHGYPPVNIRFADRRRYYSCMKIFDRKGDIKPMIRFMIAQFGR